MLPTKTITFVRICRPLNFNAMTDPCVLANFWEQSFTKINVLPAILKNHYYHSRKILIMIISLSSEGINSEGIDKKE